MTEADDTLSRLFREPMAPERDAVFAVSVATEVAAARRVQRVYRAVMIAALLVVLAGVGLCIPVLTAVAGQTLRSLAASFAIGPGIVPLILALLIASGAVAISQWLARRPV